MKWGRIFLGCAGACAIALTVCADAVAADPPETSHVANAPIAGAAVDPPPVTRVELFQEISTTNTEDLIHVRDAAVAKQPQNGEWTARSRTFVFGWDLLGDEPERLATLPLQVTLFDGVVCVPKTRALHMGHADNWVWRAYCESSGITLHLVIRTSDRTFVGSAHIPEAGMAAEVKISQIPPRWGVTYQIDPAKVPPEYWGGQP